MSKSRGERRKLPQKILLRRFERAVFDHYWILATRQVIPQLTPTSLGKDLCSIYIYIKRYIYKEIYIYIQSLWIQSLPEKVLRVLNYTPNTSE